MTFGHGGNIYEVARRLGCQPSNIIDMSSNINPLGPPPGMLDFLKARLPRITRLPEIDSRETITGFADYLGIEPEQLVIGNGTTQFIFSLPRILGVDQAIIVGPTYSDYEDALNRCRIPSATYLSDEVEGFRPDLERLSRELDGADTVYLCNPNNPTGVLIPPGDLGDLCQAHPRVNFIVDESYLPFVDRAEEKSLIACGLENVLVLLSISKIFGVPGLRIGFIIGHPDRLNAIRSRLLPWNVNSLAQEAVQFVATNRSLIDRFLQQTRAYCREQRLMLSHILAAANGYRLVSGETPFLLVKLPPGLSARDIQDRLNQDLILIRDCSNFSGLSDQFIRLSLKQPDLNQVLANHLRTIIKNTEPESLTGRMAC